MPDESSHDPQRQFMEQMILRFERAFRSVDRDIRASTRLLSELSAEVAEHRRELQEAHEAQRRTLLAILERVNRIELRQGPASAG